MGRFEQVWAGEPEPRLRLIPPDSAAAPTGAGAARFAAWVETHLGSLTAGERKPTIIEINRFKIRLVDRLLAEHLAMPEPQRSLVRDAEGAPGLLGIFLETLETVSELALAAEPPPLWEPPKPQRPRKEKPPQPAGTWFVTEAE